MSVDMGWNFGIGGAQLRVAAGFLIEVHSRHALLYLKHSIDQMKRKVNI